ncbi:MAG: RluA family pseudouridine synthase [Clostridia bacterium]|nr:RluA family pseudouridine synthase [Clostridia bacterium]
MKFEYQVTKPTTLKDFLLCRGFSKNVLNNMLNQKTSIYINGKLYKDNYHLNENDLVTVEFFDETTSVKPVNKPINIIYEDDYFIVLNKPKNLATIPTMARFDDNLASRLKYYFDKTNQKIGIHVITRLDYETSGIVLFCKHQILTNELRKVNFTKKYSATVLGKITPTDGEINKPILKIGGNKKRVIDPSGKPSITRYKLIDYTIAGNSNIELELLTGRTHQIRIHLSSIGFPLTGDTLYGDATNCDEFNLTCKYLSFYFPINKKEYTFTI